MIALRALVPYAAPTAAPAGAPLLRCELCGAPLGGPHRHVVERGVRGVRCACVACGVLFLGGAAAAPYRTVPDRIAKDPAFAMTTERWVELGIPVGLAFLVRDAASARVVAGYPGPAGVTDAELDPAAWSAIERATPLAARLEPDVEALLVRGERGARAMACYLIPITLAYELAGRLRGCWRGFSGGDEAHRELAAFFAELDRRGESR